MLNIINNKYHENYLNKYEFNEEKEDLNKYSEIFSLSIIILKDYNDLIIDVLNQKNLFYLDIEIIIVDNDYNNKISEELKEVLYYKNIELKIIECYKEEINENKVNICNLISSKENIFVLNYSINNYYLVNIINEEKIYKNNMNINDNYYIKLDKKRELINNIKTLY